jgi:hypothetical protein
VKSSDFRPKRTSVLRTQRGYSVLRTQRGYSFEGASWWEGLSEGELGPLSEGGLGCIVGRLE